MIRIGVDGRLLQGNLTGIGKYVLNLIHYIKDNSTEIDIVIFSNKKVEVDNKRFQIIYDKAFYSKLKPMFWSKFFLYRLVNKNNIDIFFSGDGFLPFFIRVKKVISVVHDFNHILVPETMSKLRLISARLFYKRDVLKASCVIANSYGTGQKLKNYYKRKADIIIYPIIDNRYKRLEKDVVAKQLSLLKITFPYILSVATQEPRKNLLKTIDAFTALKNEGEIPLHKLLLVGSKGWKSSKVESLFESNADIINLGYIKDKIMPYLYNGADLFVFPSKYEGFGMPPREALLCGTKVVVSNTPELKEATCAQGRYIDIENKTEYKSAIVDGITDKNSVSFLENIDYKDQIELLIPLLENLSESQK